MRSEVRGSQRKRKLTISRCFLLIDYIQTLRTEEANRQGEGRGEGRAHTFKTHTAQAGFCRGAQGVRGAVGILEQQEASGRIKAQPRPLPSHFHGVGVLQPMKPLPVHHFLHTLWCVGARTPNHQRTREKAGFLGEIHPTKLTITLISNPQLLEILIG